MAAAVDRDHDYRSVEELLRDLEAKVVELLERDDGHCTVVASEPPNLLPAELAGYLTYPWQSWMSIPTAVGAPLELSVVTGPGRGIELELRLAGQQIVWRQRLGFAPG